MLIKINMNVYVMMVRLVKVQQLRELEEILKFKRTENDSPDVADEYLGKVKRLWTQR